MALTHPQHTPLINVFRGVFQLIWNDSAINELVSTYSLNDVTSFHFEVLLDDLTNNSTITIGSNITRFRNQFFLNANIPNGVYNVKQINLITITDLVSELHDNIISPNGGANLTIFSPSLNLNDVSNIFTIPL